MTETLELPRTDDEWPADEQSSPRIPGGRLATLAIGGILIVLGILGTGWAALLGASSGSTSAAWTPIPADFARIEVLTADTSIIVVSEPGRSPGFRISAPVSALWPSAPSVRMEHEGARLRLTVEEVPGGAPGQTTTMHVQLGDLSLRRLVVRTPSGYAQVQARAEEFELDAGSADLVALSEPQLVRTSAGGISIGVPRGSGPYAIEGFREREIDPALTIDSDASHRILAAEGSYLNLYVRD